MRWCVWQVGFCGGVSKSIRVKITTDTVLVPSPSHNRTIKGNVCAHHPFTLRACVQKDSISEVQALKTAVGKLTNLGGACPTLPLPCYPHG